MGPTEGMGQHPQRPTGPVEDLVRRPAALDEYLRSLTPAEALVLRHDWQFWARPEQLWPDGEWRVWLMLGGRGAGKTRSGAEAVRSRVESGRAVRVGVIGRTAADVRDVMVEGPSGLLNVFPPWTRPHWIPSSRKIEFAGGGVATTYSAEEPDQLRGPEHDLIWADELASWDRWSAWDNALLGLRYGDDPRGVVTTTSKPRKQLKALIEHPTTHLTRTATYDNASNLPPAFLERIIARYQGTRLGRQELLGEYLEDVPGALWTRAMIESARSRPCGKPERVIVAVDPAVTSGEDSDETGIVVACSCEGGGWRVLADRSCRLSPDGWARRVAIAAGEFHADRVVAEVNNGGDLVERVLRMVAPDLPYKAVSASRGKRVRAEPVAALYERGRVGHAEGLETLEDQMASFAPDGGAGSPDRVDALVWAMTELAVESYEAGVMLLDVDTGQWR